MLRFAKYHGLGNDFIVVDRLAGGDPLAPDAVRALCDRHRGVGADGVLSLWPAAGLDGRMQTQNADGSAAEVCGNGLRCVGRYLYDAGRVAGERAELRVAAGDRVYPVARLAVDRYRVRMGCFALAHPDLPPRATTERRGAVDLDALGRRFVATCVHLGNPHAVIFADDEEGESATLRALAERYGAALERHPAFVNRVNVSFAARRPHGFAAVVYERGAGITQACGSGACAIGAAAVASGRLGAGEPIDIVLPGGSLRVTIDTHGEIELEGEAVRVFTGEAEQP